MFSPGFGFLTTGDVDVKHHPSNSGRKSPKSTKICIREQMPGWCYKQCWQTLPGCWGGSFSAPEIPSCPHLEGFMGELRTSTQFFSTWCRFLRMLGSRVISQAIKCLCYRANTFHSLPSTVEGALLHRVIYRHPAET